MVISRLDTMNIDISSQLLRLQWHQEGKSLRYYVPDAVADYINEHHVYHITEGARNEWLITIFIKMQKKLSKYLDEDRLSIRSVLCLPVPRWQ